MITTNNITVTTAEKKNVSIIEMINKKIEKEQENSFGITILFVMISTMISSVAIGLALHDGFSFAIVALSSVTAMGTNAAAFSQSPFKYVVWLGTISIITNTLLVLLQLPKLF
ncbi:hypothetical protein [Tenacibaculum sp. 190524A05c]|uniref:hypothetical protein n=1 Tax=Tenacibaculum platacis TaxID=3137852 RepID=UPI0031FAA906